MPHSLQEMILLLNFTFMNVEEVTNAMACAMAVVQPGLIQVPGQGDK